MERNDRDQAYMFADDKDRVYLSNVVTDPDIQVAESQMVGSVGRGNRKTTDKSDRMQCVQLRGRCLGYLKKEK